MLRGQEPLGALLLWAGQGRAGAVPAEAAASNGKALPEPTSPACTAPAARGHILCLHGLALSPGILRPGMDTGKELQHAPSMSEMRK